MRRNIMKFLSSLIVVSDIEKSKLFYYEVLGLKVAEDFGANVTLTGGIALQTKDSWCTFIHKKIMKLYLEEMTQNYTLKKIILIALFKGLIT